MEGSGNNLVLLSLGKLYEVYCISRNSYGKLRIKLRVLLRIEKKLSVKYVYVKVEAALLCISVKESDKVCLSFHIGFAEGCGNYRKGVGYTVLRIGVRQLGNRCQGCNGSVGISAVHRVSAGSECFACRSAVRGSACILTVGYV
jgi:hypothetical protein